MVFILYFGCVLANSGAVLMASEFALAPVVGSMEHPVTVLDVYGVVAADGASSTSNDPVRVEVAGSGGGSGGSLLLFLQTITLGNGSRLSTVGGKGSAVGGGGGAGGRVHLHWAHIPIGEDYVPIATIAEGRVDTRWVPNFYILNCAPFGVIAPPQKAPCFFCTVFTQGYTTFFIKLVRIFVRQCFRSKYSSLYCIVL